MDIGKLPFFQVVGHHFDYTSQRQRVLSENIANLDTPGYKSRDVMKFDESNFGQMLSQRLSMKTTHPAHMTQASRGEVFRAREDKTPWEISQSGNTVVAEDQVVRMQENKRDQDLTSKVYKKQLGIITAVIGAVK